MVEGRLTLEPEVKDIFCLIDEGKNFLLSGGAGSGKTYSLVSIIRQVIIENPTAKVACMTYTNAAVKEIEERVNHKNLNVSTIHDFLWDNIKHYQKELKQAIITLANDEDVRRISIGELTPVPSNYYDNLEDGIQYKEFVRLRDGIISHDELLFIANYLFKEYPKLSNIVKDKYKFIFIDEYQDTNENVVEIFLSYFNNSERKNIIGFFGDAMQSIYDDGIGNLDEYVSNNSVYEVKKSQNRRNPQLIIDLANKLRTDGIIQTPSIDPDAPNMSQNSVKQGDLLFLYSTDTDIGKTKELLEGEYNWDFGNSKETKELNLTHNLIADKAGFRTLMNVYDKDYLLSFRNRIKDYIKKNNITTDFSESTFGEVLHILQEGKSDRELSAVSPTNAMKNFIDDNKELFNYAKSLNYVDFAKLYIDKDQLLDDKKQDKEDENKKGSKRDNLIKHLFKIQTVISLYESRKYNEFLRATDYRLNLTSIEHKRILKANIESLSSVDNKTIEEVIHEANNTGICLIDDKLTDFKQKKEYLYNQIKNIEFQEFQRLYKYLEGHTPFSTQHKTKGAEFDNVLVVLDNGGWFNYNFEYLFTDRIDKESVLKRTRKLFYVCCTRAKEKLAVFFHNPEESVINKAKEWFGAESLINLDADID